CIAAQAANSTYWPSLFDEVSLLTNKSIQCISTRIDEYLFIPGASRDCGCDGLRRPGTCGATRPASGGPAHDGHVFERGFSRPAAAAAQSPLGRAGRTSQ